MPCNYNFDSLPVDDLFHLLYLRKKQTNPERSLYKQHPHGKISDWLSVMLKSWQTYPTKNWEAFAAKKIVKSGAEGLYQSLAESFFLSEFSACEFQSEVSPKKKIILQLTEYNQLTDGWDGYNGIAPSKAALEEAITMINAIPKKLPLPKPMVSGDGEVGLYWKQEDAFIDIEFSGNRRVTYYARGKDGQEFFGDDKQFSSDEIPSDILEILKKLI